jgi:hypothetical protein
MTPEWQPIETAPKDGTEILTVWPFYRGGFNPKYLKSGVPIGDRVMIVRWYSYEDAGSSYYDPAQHKSWRKYGDWQTLSGQTPGGLDEGDGPTHWMPLPPLPGDPPR